MKSQILNHITLVLTAILFSLLDGCTNGSSPFSGERQRPILTPDDTLASNARIMNTIVKNNFSPATTFDIIGDGSGALGRACYTPGLEGSANSSSSGLQTTPTCSCVYSYEISPGVKEEVSVPIHYLESNIVRCRFDIIPLSVSSVKIKLLQISSGGYSNELTYLFDGTGSNSDYSNLTNFSFVERYECRDIVTIPYFMETSKENLYDPIQSEDPHLSYPISFYTTNLALSLAAYAGAVPGISPVLQWNCSGNPRDEKKVPIYSEEPDFTGSRLIYPNKPGTFDRSSFSLAKIRGGVFDSPVHAYVAPTIPTQNPSGDAVQAGVPPLGYGSKPRTAGVSGEESCPDASIRIPEGHQWVKLWLFKKILPIRKYYRSLKFLRLNGIGCNPGRWSYQQPTDQGKKQFLFKDCNHNESFAITDNLGFGLASRILRGTNQCILPPYPGGTTRDSGLQLFEAFLQKNVALGTDLWVKADGDSFCSKSAPLDFTGVCNPANLNVPSDTQPEELPLEDNPRFEFLFVVTPVNVHSKDMANPHSPSKILQKYTPFRFKTTEDCQSDDPLNPNRDDCDPIQKLSGYGIKFNDILNPFDTPAESAGSVAFPLCTIQKKEAG